MRGADGATGPPNPTPAHSNLSSLSRARTRHSTTIPHSDIHVHHHRGDRPRAHPSSDDDSPHPHARPLPPPPHAPVFRKTAPSVEPVVEKAQHEPHWPWSFTGVTAPFVVLRSGRGRVGHVWETTPRRCPTVVSPCVDNARPVRTHQSTESGSAVTCSRDSLMCVRGLFAFLMPLMRVAYGGGGGGAAIVW